MAELKVFAEGLGAGCGRKEGTKDDSKVKYVRDGTWGQWRRRKSRLESGIMSIITEVLEIGHIKYWSQFIDSNKKSFRGVKPSLLSVWSSDFSQSLCVQRPWPSHLLCPLVPAGSRLGCASNSQITPVPSEITHQSCLRIIHGN